MQKNSYFVTVKSLSFELPQGDKLFSNISLNLGPGRYGLVGPNGIGKSTLAKIMAGDLRPTGGEIVSSHPITYLAQTEVRTDLTVSEYLVDVWDSPHFEPYFHQRLLAGFDLSARLTHLSGGEWTRVRILKALARNCGLLILDEPTNNLDTEARHLISDFISMFARPLLVISHDRELLESLDHIFELSNQGLSSYGGNFSSYQEQVQHERERQESHLSEVRREKKKFAREHHDKMTAQEKRIRRGQRKAARGDMPKIIAGSRKRQAQKTQGKINSTEVERVTKAQQKFTDLHEKSKQRSSLHLELLETIVPQRKMIFEVENLRLRFDGQSQDLWAEPLTLFMRGPRRWALRGANGSGKSTFIKVLLGLRVPGLQIRGQIRVQPHGAGVSIGFLDQHYGFLNPDQSALENFLESSLMDIVEARNALARFQFMDEKVHQKVRDLSEGEKLKAFLARILLAAQPPQLLILDEPTNNLDLESLAVLESTLRQYRGALLVVSHDQVFLEKIGIEKTISF